MRSNKTKGKELFESYDRSTQSESKKNGRYQVISSVFKRKTWDTLTDGEKANWEYVAQYGAIRV